MNKFYRMKRMGVAGNVRVNQSASKHWRHIFLDTIQGVSKIYKNPGNSTLWFRRLALFIPGV